MQSFRGDFGTFSGAVMRARGGDWGCGILFVSGPGTDFSEVPVFRVQPAALDSESPLIVVPGPPVIA